MRVILDASVLVSSILVQHPEAPPFRALNAALRGDVGLVLSTALADEWGDVLLRPETRKRSILNDDDVERLLSALSSRAMFVDSVPAHTAAPDPTDQHLWDLLETVEDSLLVTRDAKLLASADFPGRILSPRDFVDRYLA